MKKSLVLLAGMGIAFLGSPAITHAQAASGPFADVPTDHWAYQSVDTLQKAGIVIGYPDGTYGGRRPMTRYEFAVAIARLLAQIKPTDTSGLEARIAGNTDAINALKQLVNGFQDELTRLGQDVAGINARLDALEARVGKVEGRVGTLEGIVGSQEEELRRLHITGTVNAIFEGNASRKRDANGQYAPFLDKNGVYQGATGYNDRLLGSSDVYHDILLNIRGKLSDTATANVSLDFGNYLSQVGNTAAFPGYAAGGTANVLSPGSLGSGGNTNFQYANVYKAYLDAAVKLGPLGGAQLLVGRYGNQFTKYTLKQVDADIYTNLAQTDDGDIVGDGAGLNLGFGPVKVQAFAAKYNGIQFSQPYGGSVGVPVTGQAGNPFNPLVLGTAQSRPGGLIAANHASQIQTGVGGRATIGAPEGAVLGATVEQFGLGDGSFVGPVDGITDPNRSTQSNVLGQGNGQYNRLTVYGLDFNGALPFGLPGVKKGGILLDGAYNVSAHAFNNQFNNVGSGFRYQQYDAQAGFAIAGVQIKGGYQYFGPEYSAPGYWGKLGAWTNPTNVRGPVVSAKYALTRKLTLNADAQFYKAAYGSNSDGTAINSPLQQNDHVNRYQVGLGYGLSSAYGVDLGYENVQYDLRNETLPGGGSPLAASGRPTETYVNIGLGHTISKNASIKLLYQIVHYDDHGTGFDQVSEANNNGRSDGSVAVGQFQLKF